MTITYQVTTTKKCLEVFSGPLGKIHPPVSLPEGIGGRAVKFSEKGGVIARLCEAIPY